MAKSMLFQILCFLSCASEYTLLYFFSCWIMCFDRLLVASGPDGINKVIDRFIERFSDYSKRQVEIKINEVATKEKREEDNIKVWHIRPEFEYYLHMEDHPLPNEVGNSASAGKKATGKEKTEKKEEKDSSAKKGATSSASEKEKGKGKEVSSASKSTPAKRKAADANLDDEPEVASPLGNAAKEPKKAKSAFGLFVKAKRPEAEAKLGPDASVSRLIRLCYQSPSFISV